MDSASLLLDEILEKYFTKQDTLKDNINISLQEISLYEYKLLQTVLNDGNDALTEAIESYIDELKKEALKAS
ncbi:hypothetical protein LUD75_03415 [Epilithonimonas sp. JDS]|uniref:hypothetical protein n=1 Tax=Epilithonimonas sp. JDS TaxID=2902797 RepID=UPI001E511773|nr:hypothetical protein [Epilithonimonas sp. JDS]MCD9853735.1 hypothetical protein [Epilithonimonas sp. JDS]